MRSPYGFETTSVRVRGLRFLRPNPVGKDTRMPTITDELRHTNARAASHGYGAGQIEAARLIDSWPIDEVDEHANEVLGQVDLAQAYAQEAPSGYDDFVQRAEAGGAPVSDEARIAYQAGFDIGFSAALVEGCGTLMGRALRDDT
jgi:hypothetical protein